MVPGRFAFVLGLLAAACSPSTNARQCTEGGAPVDTESDRNHCGECGNRCGGELNCVAGRCTTDICEVGTTELCYTGSEATVGVGPCQVGERTCLSGVWGDCDGEVAPMAEDCSDGIDNNCNGEVDEDTDRDGDGFTTCGGDCCDSTECAVPALVNPGAFDVAANGVDDDCDGQVDNFMLLCDQSIASNTSDGFDFARAIDVCQRATEEDRKWGVIDAALTLVDGQAGPDPVGHAVRQGFGTNLGPIGGVSVAVLSTGVAADKDDIDPTFSPFSGYQHEVGATCGWPADFKLANGGTLPNAPGCPPPLVNGRAEATDSEMLTLRVRVPTNARSFKLSNTFYSAEFPEYACSKFNDFFVVLLDSTYIGPSPNPDDKNLAFFQPAGTMDPADRVPVGVNLANGDSGLFTQCRNGETGCRGLEPATITTCEATDQLVGTGFDEVAPRSTAGDYACNPGQLVGGATGWLTTAGNVVPGEVITLRIGIWDTSDPGYDSLVVVDGFQWSIDLTTPGTIGRVW